MSLAMWLLLWGGLPDVSGNVAPIVGRTTWCLWQCGSYCGADYLMSLAMCLLLWGGLPGVSGNVAPIVGRTT